MGKKILIISGSPRKNGNSDILCDQFLQGARERGHEVKKVSLREQKIGFCIACYACREKKVCFQQDGMNGILAEMVDADVIVMATPVYFYTMDGQMKTLIDRTLPRYQEVKSKEFYFIVTAAVQDKKKLDRTFDGFQAFLDCLPASQEKGRINGTGVYLPGDVKNTPYMELAYEMGKSI